MYLKQFLSLWYVWRNRAPIMYRNKTLHDPRHLYVPSSASKMISEAMVHLVQAVDLSCTEIDTIFKWTEMRFYLTHVT
jgi:hypothetical protein